ncbi:MAG: prolipoprotein diacylglyceryl transferase [Planctomycetes bacterium]|nr:prolipoprotein diacylglyceryl transferase [Planctomycetota bacterium]
MWPILFSIPGLQWPVYSFGAMIAIAFFVGSLYLERLAQRFGDDPANDPAKYSSLALWLLFGIIGGGRILYVLVHPEEFFGGSVVSSISAIVQIWNGGLVFYGGFIATFLIGMWKIRSYKLRRWHAADLGMIAGFLGLGIGRIGCLLVGDDHGRLCDPSLPFPIAITIPDPIPEKSFFPAEWAGKTVYATQIYMMVNGFGLALLGRWLLGRRKFAGQVTFIMMGIYAVTRGIIEYFRGDDAARGFTDVVLGSETIRLYTSVKIGMVLLPLSIVMYLVLQKRAARPAQ